MFCYRSLWIDEFSQLHMKLSETFSTINFIFYCILLKKS